MKFKAHEKLADLYNHSTSPSKTQISIENIIKNSKKSFCGIKNCISKIS